MVGNWSEMNEEAIGKYGRGILYIYVGIGREDGNVGWDVGVFVEWMKILIAQKTVCIIVYLRHFSVNEKV